MSPDAIPEFLTVDGEMARHMRAYDWHASPLGPPMNWPEGLQAAVRMMLVSGHPMLIWWGRQNIQLYNDAHAPSLGQDLHPHALGRPGAEIWRESWDVLGQQIERVLAGGGAGWFEDHPMPFTRNGQCERTHWTYSLDAIQDPEAPNGIGGVMLIGTETTKTMRELRSATERLAARTAEHARAALAHARQRALAEAGTQWLALVAPNGMLHDANSAALRAINARPEDLVGQKLWDMPWFSRTAGLPPQIEADFHCAMKGETLRREILLNLPSGTHEFDYTLRPALDDLGGSIGAVLVATEMTAWRNVEEKKCQAVKMEAIGQLTGGIAHDFNNLLTGISGSLDLLKNRIAQGRIAEADRYIMAAETSSRRAAALTHQLLAFSRRQTLDPRPVLANKLISTLEGSLTRTIGPRVALRLRLVEGLWTIMCDARQLENALVNLCLNARDAMPDGGVLTIQTDNVILDAAQARARDMKPGPYVAIAVTDTGSGMTPEVATRAFDPFFTTKPIGMGTGLGLSMIYGFTQQSGGQVRIHSSEGEGTTMRMFLPRHVVGEPEATAPVHRSVAARAQPGETVLVVDDEPSVRMLVTEVLEELGYASMEAADGAAGLKVLQSPARVDLLITDVGLPGGMNGRQMADAARQSRPGLKVLFITGYAETAVVGNGSLGPGMEVMTKPFPLDALAARIQAMILG